ncbi:MAG: rane protein [Labilithrix sp.]|nr:rane protein [Labilithrix sp.]
MSDDLEQPFNPKPQALVAFLCGVLFAVGLGLAGMTSPAKVLAFLDVTSPSWDPSLAFVMAGAIGVHFLFARRAVAASDAGRPPVLARRWSLPERKGIDRTLLAGAALFGLGWGLGGYCPGPALVAFVVTPMSVIFVGAMLAGMWGTRVVRERFEARAADRALADEMEREIEREMARHAK